MGKQVDFDGIVATLKVIIISQHSREFIDVNGAVFPGNGFSAIDEGRFRVGKRVRPLGEKLSA